MKKTFRKIAIDAMGITMLTIVMTVLLKCGIQPFPFPVTIQQNADFQLSDLFQAVTYDNKTATISKDIVIVATDSCEGRMDVVKLLDTISSSYDVRAIGLDIFFSKPKDTLRDDSLLHALQYTPKLICASKITDTIANKELYMTTIKQSFFDNDTSITRHLRLGYINFPSDSLQEVVRAFYPISITPFYDTLYCFAAAILQVADTFKFRILLQRQRDREYINYHATKQIKVIPYQSVLTHELDANELNSKIVLIGDTGNVADLHRVPFQLPKIESPSPYNQYATPGVVLHAYILQTMLDQDYITPIPNWLNWLIAFLLSELMIIILLYAKNHMGDFSNLVVRLTQFALLFCSVWIGVWCLQYTNYYIDFSSTLLMIAFCLIAYALWFGGCAIVNRSCKYIQKKRGLHKIRKK